MADERRNRLRQVLQNQVRRMETRIDKLDEWDRRISRYRLAVFLLGSITAYPVLANGTTLLSVFFLLLIPGSFLVLVYRHQRLDRQRQRFSIWKETRQTHLARLDLDWDALPRDKTGAGRGGHEYADDLNITGTHSLIRLTDTAIYAGGTERLTGWLLENRPDRETINKRQRLVRELTPMAHFRDRLQLQAAIAKSFESAEQDWTMPKLLRWLDRSSTDSYRRTLLLLGSLALSNWVLGILFLAGVLKPYVIVTFLLYLVIYNFNSDKIKGLFDAAYQIEKLLRRFGSILLYLEEYPYKEGSLLKPFCAMYHTPEAGPSHFLNKIARIAMAVSMQKNDLVRGMLNFLLPWDLFFAHKLNRYKAELRDPLGRWLDRFHELEALCSLANFAWLNPGYTFGTPVAVGSRPVLHAKKLGHPLIPHQQKVCNDITIDENGALLLITGSNMSGKSTFLRTLGINLCLCLAGGPVNAESFRTAPFRLFSSINVTDSLDRGLSHFYAEVRKLRRLLDELNREDARPLFFLVDEIYRGTNNRERLTGSSAFLQYVAGNNGVGVISTHDLELANLEEQIPQLKNYHFEETIRNGKMSFEYKLKPGPCPTTNALTIMKMEGLPVGRDDAGQEE